MSLQLIDTHSHIYDPQFDADRDEAVARARAAGVGRILLPAVDAESYGAMFALARQYPELCRPMMGLHPTSVNDNPRWREDLEQVARYLAAPPEGIRFCGVGEVGLDLYWSRDFLSQQQQALRFQVELSLQYGLPLVIHTRDAWDEMCALLDAFRGRGVRGILHSFCGTADHYRALKAAGVGDKLPDLAKLREEYSRLSEEKDRLYAEYESLKKRMREYDAVKQNIDSILSPNRGQEQDKAL